MKNKNYMNKLRMALMIGLFTMLNVAANAQVYTVGTGGNYTSLYAAFDDINNGGITSDISNNIFFNADANISMNEEPENGVVEIFSLDGKLLIKNSISNMNHTLSVESLTKGTYILHVSTNQKTYTTKFVRQ